MSLVATFGADFAQFDRAVSEAQVHLQGLERGAKTAARGLTRELESISGQKVAVEAARMAEAIKRLGGEGGTAAGLLKLTDEELRRVTATMDAATAKAARLGEALPDSLKQVNAEIAKLPKPVEASNRGLGILDATFGKLTASFAAASLIDKAVGGLFELGRAAVTGAGELVDLNASTRVGIEMLQRWSAVARLGGIELEDMTTASFRLSAAIDGGGRSVREAVGRLGLEFARLRDLKPEDQLDAVLRAAEALGDSQGRNATLVQLFGTRGAEALARVVDGYEAVKRAAVVAGDEQVRALDKASEAWDSFVADTLAAAKQIAGNIVLALPKGSDPYKDVLRKGLPDTGARTEDVALTEQAAAAARDYAAEIAALRAELAQLTPAQRAQLDAAVALGVSTEEITRRFGLAEEAQRLYVSTTKDSAKSLESADDAQARFNDSVARNAEESKRAAAELQRLIATTNTKIEFGGDTFADMTKVIEDRLTGPMVRAYLDNVKATADYQRQMDAFSRDRTMTRLNAEIAAIDQWATDQKAALNTADASWKQSAAAIDEFAEARKRALIEDDEIAQLILFANLNTDAAKRVKELAREIRQQGVTAIRELSGAIADLAQATGGTDGFLGHLAQVVGLMGVAGQAGNNVADIFERWSQGGDAGKKTAGDFAALAANILSTAAALEQATDQAGQFNRALAGAAVGAQAGAAFGPWGAAIGGALGGLTGALRNPAFEDVMRRVGHDWGVTLSEELARSIADQAKTLFGGNRQAAEIFNLDAILGEAGGLSDENLSQMTARLRDVFVMLETGAFTGAQAVSVLDENFQDFIDAATDGSGRLSQEMVEIIRLTREFGLESEAVTGYVRDQAQAAIAGANAVIGYLSQQYDAYQDIADGVREAQQRIDDLNRTSESGRGVDWTRDMQRAQADLTRFLGEQHAAGEAVRGELELVGQIAVGVYGAAVEAGLSHSEALQAALPGLSQLVTAYENLGISAQDAGLAALLPQAELARNNPQLLAGVDGLAQSFTALSNLGLLNADTFGQMEQAALTMFTRIQGELAAQGVDMSTNLQALIPMQDYLRAAAEQAELLGVALDPTTQMLIDQSKELGLWRDEGEDAGESLQDTMRELRDVFKELATAMKDVPRYVTTDVTTRYHQEGAPGGGATPTPTAGPSAAATAAATRAGGRTMALPVIVNIDGRTAAKAIAPYRLDAEYAWGV